MNFLAHSIVLPPNSTALIRVASAIPDLWPRLSPRPLPALILRRLRSSLDRRCAELAYGIAHHIQADAVFHSLDAFNRRVSWLSGEIDLRWPSLHQTSFYAHVLIEMLLDRWLMEQDPGHLDLYYDACQPDTLAFAAEHAICSPSTVADLHAVLSRFAATQFLRSYTTPLGLAARFLGFTRALPWPWEWQDCRQQELADCLERWHERLGPESAALVEPVREAVASRVELLAPL